MDRLMPLFEEYASGKDQHLVIVDVQREFKQWMKPDYIENVSKYAERFPHVYQIWDQNRASKPSETFPNQKMAVPKRYGYDLTRREIRDLFTGNMQKELLSDYDGRKYMDGDHKRKTYSARNGDMLVYVGRSHQFFMAEPELIKFMEYLKQLKEGVTLIGGADNECLADIEALMQHFGIEYDLNKEYVYSAATA